MLIVYCWATSDHKSSSLKRHTFMISQSCKSEVWVSCSSAGCPALKGAQAKCQPHHIPFWELCTQTCPQAQSGCQPNSVSRDRTVGSVYLQAVSRGWVFAPFGSPHPSHASHAPRLPTMASQVPFRPRISHTSSSASSP